MKTKQAKEQDPKKSRAAKILGKNIRFLRMEKGYSQEELAEYAEVHRNQIGIIERGESNTLLLNIENIAIALNITIADLFRDPPYEEKMIQSHESI